MSATPADTLRAIIASVEEAEGPCRELDAAIFPRVEGDYFNAPPWRYLGDGRWNDDSEPCGHNVIVCARYTASLDAAVSLVPSGWQWTACMRDTMLGDDTGEGHVHNGELNMSGKRRSFDVFAATPALALTAAALRARLAIMEDGA